MSSETKRMRGGDRSNPNRSRFQAAAGTVGAAAVRENRDRVAGQALSRWKGEEKKEDPDTSDKEKMNPDDEWSKLAYASRMAAMAAKNQRATANQKLFSRVVDTAHTWDVWTPPPSNSVSGKVVPHFVNRHKHRRRCSIEIHRVTPVGLEEEKNGNENENQNENENEDAQEPDSYEECVVRLLVPATRELNRKVRNEALRHLMHKGPAPSSADTHVGSRRDLHASSVARGDGDVVDNYTNDDDDDSTVNSYSRFYQLADHGGKHYDEWAPKYSIPMHGLYVRSTNKKAVSILVSFDDFKQERELIFDTTGDAKSFCKLVEKQKRLEAQRQDRRLKVALGGEMVLPQYETITLLVEIVAGYDLPVGDYTSSDPYVVAMLGHQEVHRTEVRFRTLNPIWTLKTGSLFLLHIESKRLFIEEGMKFVVKDYDNLGKHDVLGVCQVDPKVLYKANGERMEFGLGLPPHKQQLASVGSEPEKRGILVIRCRRATEYDQSFMAEYRRNEEKKMDSGVAAEHNAPDATTNVFKTITTKVKKRDREDGIIKYKIRPGSDPSRPPSDTEWMSDADLQKEVLKTSRQWVDMGEGTLGQVFVEILGCDDLPNMDTGGFYGNKTDAFVSCVYEDVHGRTDVVDDCLSPRWLPWSNRAFIFNMSHPSSNINIGVFDYDSGPLADHDLIGRVSVDLTNFRSSTEYVLSYNICQSARLAKRKSKGKVMIRLRMEINDERELAMATLRPPVPTYVNTKKAIDFQVIRQTCFGSIDENKYSVTTLKSHIDELFELQHVAFYIEDALMTVLLWRGHFELTVPLWGKTIELPVHSAIAFVLAIVLVENPTLFPSYCFGTLAWLLIAVGGWRMSSENVWVRCHSYFQILNMLLLGDDHVEPHRIQPFENFDKAREEEEEWVKRVEDSEKRAEELAEAATEAEKERQRELAEIGEADTELGTKVGEGGLAIDPMRAALFPIQITLGIVVKGVRVLKHVFTWQEAYFSFWITTGSLVMSILCLFIPWAWCIKWGSRIFAWTIFGPWMKLLDLYYFSLIKPETDEERRRREQAEKLKQKLATTEAVMETRILRENLAKTKAMKKYMFGEYSVRVPIIKQDRFVDIPLAESFAYPYVENNLSLAELAMREAGKGRVRIPGQTLVGDMIPCVKGDGFTVAPVGKAALHTEKLAKDAPGARGKMTNMNRITTTVVLAILATYYGTPMIGVLLSEGEKWIVSEL